MRRILLAAVVACCLPVAVAAAQRQIVQDAKVRVSFEGQLLPRALPRERPAPVTVHLAGKVDPVGEGRPPQLRELEVAFNRAGRLSVAGLPSCSAAQLQQTSTEAALARCRGALLGHGHYAASVDFEGAPLIPAEGKVLVFNGSRRGHPSMLLHLYGTRPVRAAFVLPFDVARRAKGEFGTIFSAKIPRLAADLGYVNEIELTLGRRYRYAGKSRSFLSASCAAPAGFPGAVYKLARATFTFPENERLTSNLSGDCRVR
jgi:hypothetical protein